MSSPTVDVIIAYERLALGAKGYNGSDGARWAVRDDQMTALRDAIQALPPDLYKFESSGTAIRIETNYVFDDKQEADELVGELTGKVLRFLGYTGRTDIKVQASVYVPAEEPSE